MAPSVNLRRPLRLLASLTFASVGAWGAAAAPVSVAPFPASPHYLAGKELYSSRTGTHRGVVTARYRGEPALAVRPLSVDPETSLNGELGRFDNYRSGPGAMPPVYGGLRALVNAMPSAGSLTARTQFQNGPDARGDFINYNLYLESAEPAGPGIAYRFVGALLFPAGPAGAADIVPLAALDRVTYVGGAIHRSSRQIHVLVRDPDSGRYYLSEASSTHLRGSIPLLDTRWAPLSATTLTPLGDFADPPFRRIDHIGLLFDTGRTETSDTTRGHGVVANFALYSLEYHRAEP